MYFKTWTYYIAKHHAWNGLWHLYADTVWRVVVVFSIFFRLLKVKTLIIAHVIINQQSSLYFSVWNVVIIVNTTSTCLVKISTDLWANFMVWPKKNSFPLLCLYHNQNNNRIWSTVDDHTIQNQQNTNNHQMLGGWWQSISIDARSNSIGMLMCVFSLSYDNNVKIVHRFHSLLSIFVEHMIQLNHINHSDLSLFPVWLSNGFFFERRHETPKFNV